MSGVGERLVAGANGRGHQAKENGYPLIMGMRFAILTIAYCISF